MNVQTELLTLLQRLTEELDSGLSTSTLQQSDKQQQQHKQEVTLDYDQLAVKKIKFTCNELLKVKKKNSKSTKAQIYTHVCHLNGCAHMHAHCWNSLFHGMQTGDYLFTNVLCYFIQKIIREAAKEVDIWETAPTLDVISHETMTRFEEIVFQLCPVLKEDPKKLHKVLGHCLNNRRAYLKKGKVS